jgi:threonine dehydrogenase-like Zn-dependent dehydrogenase
MKKIIEGKLDPIDVVSHRVRLDDLETVYEKFKNHKDQMHKVYVETKFSLPRAPGTPELTVYN